MRALIVTNMWPSPERPALGSFVRDQVEALRRIGGPGLELDVAAFDPGGYAGAVRDLRRRPPVDIVHAHFGLTAWPALAARAAARLVTLHGTDVRHPRSGAITRAVLPFQDLVATASAGLAHELGGRRRVAVLPCGVALDRFVPIPRAEARRRLGLDLHAPFLLFPADPARPGKRHDRAVTVAAGAGAALHSAGAVDPADMPLWINAANAVLVPSDHEGFGLAVLEALACDVPVLATPTGVHDVALECVAGALCAPFERDAWIAAARAHLSSTDPRVDGRSTAVRYGAEAMAERVLVAWNALLGRPFRLDDARSVSGRAGR
jgi:glycosyltransferase involved in cell wall biosynthesis